MVSDKELIALSLAAEASSINSELNLFRQLPATLAGNIERSVYNKRRRRLAGYTQELQQRIAKKIVPNETYHLIDSMPLEVCKMSRARCSHVCQECPEKAPSFSYCASQKLHYFGYKFHAVCTQQGVFKVFDISSAFVHNIHYLDDVKHQFEHCVIVGDKGYLSREWQADLFEHSAIALETPMRLNQKDRKSFPKVFGKARKRIETLFSQLCDQFLIRRNYAKSFIGFATRTIAKITALTIIQLYNQLAGKNINHLKSSIY